MRTALAVTQLVKHYRCAMRAGTPSVRALDGVSFSVDEGETVGIVGARGSGKSTLMLCAAGLVRPDGGYISWFGSAIAGRAAPPGIAYVPARSAYYSFLTVREALEYYSTLHDLRTQDRARQVDSAVREVALSEHASRRVGCLAAPLLQRLGLAQALIGSPRAILLDETLSGEGLLDCCIIRAVLRRLRESGVTVLIACERADEIDGIAGRVVKLANGRVVAPVETAGFANSPPPRSYRTSVLVS